MNKNRADKVGALFCRIFAFWLIVFGTSTARGQELNLTGLWRDDAGRQYRIRQVNNQLFWETDSRPEVLSVFHGTIRGRTITGEWADLPGGKLQTAGKLTLRIESGDRLVKTRDSPAYGASAWTREGQSAAAADLLGEWRWSCCGGEHSGSWQITRQEPDGSFSGAFSGKTAEDIGSIEGRVQGNQVEFVRRGAYGGESFEQRWAGTVSGTRLEGRLEQGEFTAERWINLVCEWRWTCCGGQFFGTWHINKQNPDGTFTGAFSGRTEQDIGDIEGRLQGTRVEFTRRGAYAGQPFEQRWAGTVSGKRLKGRLEHGEFSAECLTGGGDVSAETGAGGGICYDPQTLVVMDEWLQRAIPPQHPADSLKYDAWGRAAGQTRTGVVGYPARPDTRLSRCDWLWFRSSELRSANDLGTLREYVDRRRQER